MIIRQLTNEDIPKAMELKILCWTEELAGQAENTLQLNEEINFWTNWLNTPDEHNDIRVFIGAFEDFKLLGVAAGSFVESKDSPQNGIELNGLWVFPEYRGRGISLKMILYILDAFIPLGVNRIEIYNPHYAPSNTYYKKFGGKVIDTEYQLEGKLLVDIFEFGALDFKLRLENTLLRYSIELYNKGIIYNQELSDGIIMTTQHTEKDNEYVCENLILHNVKNTSGLLKKPGIDINLYLRDGNTVIGAIMCDSFNMCLYIDVMWLDESYRGKGYGKTLIKQAEKIAKDNGCMFSHTSTFNYQSPEFYQACGYEVFAKLQDYPDGIIQYFLKKKL